MLPLILAFPLIAVADEPAQPADPFVALDAAKTTLAEGKLEDARKELAQIPTDEAEAYVNEEVVFQRMRKPCSGRVICTSWSITSAPTASL